MLMKNYLLAIEDINKAEVLYLLKGAKKLAQAKSVPLFLNGKTVANLFFENSTRTRSSFEIATRKLGGSVLNFTATTSSVQKGESLIDTARNIEAMQPSCIVVRHASAGSPKVLADAVNIPVVNAGDGFHEHPTQALLDVFTIEEKLGSVLKKKILIIGDIAHSRVARSDIHLLKKLGAQVSVCGPPTLLPPEPESLGVSYSYRLEDFLNMADVIIALRIQLERQNKMQIPTLNEYAKFWGINAERAKLIKKGAIILHPGPINRGVELQSEVADGPLSVILDQVANGVLVRMSVLAALCMTKEYEEWVKYG
ncbi:MAG: aspartate carbamoyltransferase catalytic subunit [Bdellovibrio sp.]|nr:aspartate carbamoyltransferase catalytic subunit [Bdellovibrio sp.]